MSDIVITAKVDEGITLATTDGHPLHLAVVDSEGRIVSRGAVVANQVFRAAVQAYDDFWQGNGHLTTITPL